MIGDEEPGHDERDPEPADPDREREKFAEELIERGAAAKPDAEGKLPPGATHEILEGGPDEPPRVRRRRFSLS